MDISPWDWHRIFIGEAPAEFLLEVLIRTLIMYLLLLVVVRMMGKRMSGQISISEFAVMITLGAIISPGMQLPDRSILFGCISLFTIYFLHRLLNTLSTKFEKFAIINEGTMECIVKNGILDIEKMKKLGISRQELFAQLRQKNIEILSQVDRVYLEACGTFSIFSSAEKVPGLPTFPEKDKLILASKYMVDDNELVCNNCGHLQNVTNRSQKCEVCGVMMWGSAYV